jgi:hypothetical protein
MAEHPLATESQAAAIRGIVDVIVTLGRDMAPMGAPSGVIYAALNAKGMTLDQYQALIAGLVNAGRIRVVHDCLVAV